MMFWDDTEYYDVVNIYTFYTHTPKHKHTQKAGIKLVTEWLTGQDDLTNKNSCPWQLEPG